MARRGFARSSSSLHRAPLGCVHSGAAAIGRTQEHQMKQSAKRVLSGCVVIGCGLAACLAAAVQDVPPEERRPPFPASGPTVESFVPPGYTIERREESDFDGDGLRDAALLLVPACEGVEEVLPAENCRSDGRMLVIVLGTAPGGYRLAIAKPIVSTVGPHGGSFGGMKVRGRTLTFAGAHSSCAGQAGESGTETFRFQNGDWFLIGRTESTWHQSTACGGGPIGTGLCPELTLRPGEACVRRDRSWNLLTSMQESKWSIQPEDGDTEGKEREVVQRRKFPQAPLPRLADYLLGF
jgi:hypothetical protein